MELLAQARGQETDDALVPPRVVEHEAVRARRIHRLRRRHRLLLHVPLDLPPLPVEAVEALREFTGTRRIGRHQAFDTDGHVLQPASGVEAGPEEEPEVLRGGAVQRPPGRLGECRDAGAGPAGAHAREPLGHEDAVVVIQRDHVGHRPERHEVQVLGEIGLGRRRERAASPQFRAQREHGVEHDADACEMLAGEGAAGLVRVDDDAGGRQFRTREVVVRDEHLDAQAARLVHAFQARDAVVHRHDEVGSALGRHPDDLRRESVAVLEAVGDEAVHRGAEAPQRQDAHGRGRRAVGIVVTDDEEAPPGRDGIRQDLGQGVGAGQRCHRDQAVEPAFQGLGRRDSARGPDAGQHRMAAAGRERRGRRIGIGSSEDHGVAFGTSPGGARPGGRRDLACDCKQLMRHKGRRVRSDSNPPDTSRPPESGPRRRDGGAHYGRAP